MLLSNMIISVLRASCVTSGFYDGMKSDIVFRGSSFYLKHTALFLLLLAGILPIKRHFNSRIVSIVVSLLK